MGQPGTGAPGECRKVSVGALWGRSCMSSEADSQLARICPECVLVRSPRVGDSTRLNLATCAVMLETR